MERKQRFITNVIYYGMIGALACMLLKYAVPLCWPFLTAFFVAWMLHAPARLIARRLGVSDKLPALLLTALFYIGAALLALLAVRFLLTEAERFLPMVPGLYADYILPFLNGIFDRIEDGLSRANPAVVRSLTDSFEHFTASVGQSVSDISVEAVRSFSGYAAGLPSLFLKVVLTVVATFFFSADYGKITGAILRLLPEKPRFAALRIRSCVGNVLFAYVRSYSLLMLLTFAQLLAGFLLLDVRRPFLLAFLIALFDILPILGCGGILLPWAVGAAFRGDLGLFAGLILLYIFLTAVRNTLEPKIVGRQMGLNPLVTLISMFLGLQLFGFLGLFGFPVSIAVLLRFHGSSPDIS